jgi:hypothetical protein
MNMSLWKKISSFVHGAAVKVSDAFVKIFGKDAAHQFAQGTLALLKTAEGKIVLDAVEAVSTLSLDGAGKRAAAFEKIASDFTTQGYSVGENVINMLVELAVTYLKGTIAAA